MKVRIGIALPGLTAGEGFDRLLDQLETAKIDSLWLSELISTTAPDPIVGLAHAAAKTQRLKLGTGVSVLPGRNPVLFAKQLATLARFAPGRILPAVGLGPARAAERDAFAIPPGARRGEVFDEALTVVRRLLTEPEITFTGRYFTLRDIGVGELPTKPLDIWLGGSAPTALERVGRLGDGWLASIITPEEAAAGIEKINVAATGVGRQVDPEHFGISLPVAETPGDGPDGVPGPVAVAITKRRAATPGPLGAPRRLDPKAFVPVGWDDLRARISEFVTAGVSKFVVRPATPPTDWPAFVDRFATELKGIET